MQRSITQTELSTPHELSWPTTSTFLSVLIRMGHQTLEAFCSLLSWKWKNFLQKSNLRELSSSANLTPHNNVTSGVNKEWGLAIKSREEMQNLKKILLSLFFWFFLRKSCFLLCWLNHVGKRDWFLFQGELRLLKNALNAHKESSAWSRRTPELPHKSTAASSVDT